MLHGLEQIVTEISLQILTPWNTVTLEKLIVAQAFNFFLKAKILIALLYDSIRGLIKSVHTLILNFFFYISNDRYIDYATNKSRTLKVTL